MTSEVLTEQPTPTQPHPGHEQQPPKPIPAEKPLQPDDDEEETEEKPGKKDR